MSGDPKSKWRSKKARAAKNKIVNKNIYKMRAASNRVIVAINDFQLVAQKNMFGFAFSGKTI